MYPVEAHIELVTGQSFLHKAESLRTISSKISFRRRYTQRGHPGFNSHGRSDFVCVRTSLPTRRAHFGA